MTVEPRVQKVFLLDTTGTIVNPGGSASDYTILLDEQATYTYIGKALPGTATSAASWKISRLENSSGSITWADAVSTLTKVWDNRATYTYS